MTARHVVGIQLDNGVTRRGIVLAYGQCVEVFNGMPMSVPCIILENETTNSVEVVSLQRQYHMIQVTIEGIRYD